MTAFWLIAFIALVAGEAATVGLVCIWFAAGAVGGFLVAILGGQFWFQLIVFAAVSALALALVRPAASRFVHPRRSPPTPTGCWTRPPPLSRRWTMRPEPAR